MENPERGLQQPPFGGRVTKNTPGGRGLFYVTLMSPLHQSQGILRIIITQVLTIFQLLAKIHKLTIHFLALIVCGN